MIVWITGISGAGKTTLGKRLVSEFKKLGRNIIFLDGDELRSVFKSENTSIHYDRTSRIEIALKYSRLCALLSKQGTDVVIATISMYREVFEWNSKNLSDYYEIFLDVPNNIVMDRDAKGIYTDYQTGKIKNVAGFDLKVDLPRDPALVIKNYGQIDPAFAVRQILEVLNA